MRVLCITSFLLLVTPSLGQTVSASRIQKPNPLFEFSAARGEFAEAAEQFRKGFWQEKNRRGAAKKIEKNVDIFLKYLRTISTNRAGFEPAELKTLTNAQLAVEALALADALRPSLNGIVRMEYGHIVTVQQWEVLYRVEADLLRLKWMSSRLGKQVQK